MFLEHKHLATRSVGAKDWGQNKTTGTPSRKIEAKNWGESKPPVLTPIAFTDFLKKLSLSACWAPGPAPGTWSVP